MGLRPTDLGYGNQDLLTAIRLVDVVLGRAMTVVVDTKLFKGNLFDDLTSAWRTGSRERLQIKHTADERELTLDSFTGDRRGLRLDKVIASIDQDLRDHAGVSFRLVLRDQKPNDPDLIRVLVPLDASADPGPALQGLSSTRLRFDAAALRATDPWRSVTARELLPWLDLAVDFGAVHEGHPVDATVEITRPTVLDQLATAGARRRRAASSSCCPATLVQGSPGCASSSPTGYAVTESSPAITAGSARANRAATRPISSSNIACHRPRSTLWPAATAGSFRVHTTRDDQAVATPRPGPPRRKITNYNWRTRPAGQVHDAGDEHGVPGAGGSQERRLVHTHRADPVQPDRVLHQRLAVPAHRPHHRVPAHPILGRDAGHVRPSSPTRRHASARARSVSDARARIAWLVSVHVPTPHAGSAQRHTRLTHTSVTGGPPQVPHPHRPPSMQPCADTAAAAELLLHRAGLHRLLQLAVPLRHRHQHEAGQAQHHRRRANPLSTAEREELKWLRAENAELRRELDPAGGERAFAKAVDRPGRGDPVIDTLQGRLGVERLCRVLGAPASTYYARRSRPPSKWAVADAQLLEQDRRRPRDPDL